MIPADLLQRHRTFNRNSSNRWEAFAGHRERVTSLLLERPGGRLAVLGAGNANDLALDRLVAGFGEVHLVDLDKEALRRAQERQEPAVAAALHLHVPVDVTGSLDRLAGWKRKGPTPAALEQLAAAPASTVPGKLPAPFDQVVSTCLLGQIMHTIRLAVGEHPQLHDIAKAAAVGHLRLLGELCRPGGRVLLVTDAVSSETYPLDELWGQRPPRELLAHLEETENIFSGTGPSYLRQLLTGEGTLRALFPQVRLVEPWLWHLGDDVTLLTYALDLPR